jgi:hypothetical protein
MAAKDVAVEPVGTTDKDGDDEHEEAGVEDADEEPLLVSSDISKHKIHLVSRRFYRSINLQNFLFLFSYFFFFYISIFVLF